MFKVVLKVNSIEKLNKVFTMLLGSHIKFDEVKITEEEEITKEEKSYTYTPGHWTSSNVSPDGGIKVIFPDDYQGVAFPDDYQGVTFPEGNTMKYQSNGFMYRNRNGRYER